MIFNQRQQNKKQTPHWLKTAPNNFSPCTFPDDSHTVHSVKTQMGDQPKICTICTLSSWKANVSVRYCCVNECKNNETFCNVSLYKFPRNVETRQKWIDFVIAKRDGCQTQARSFVRRILERLKIRWLCTKLVQTKIKNLSST